MASVAERMQDLYERLTGHPMGEPDPPENDLIKELGQDFHAMLLGYGQEILGRITMILRGHGVPRDAMPYFFWVLFANRRSWPDKLTGHQIKAILLARDILTLSDKVPPYQSAFRVPGEDVEPLIDMALEDFGDWAIRKMAAGMLQKAMDLFKEFAPRMRKLHPELDRGAMFYTKAKFEDAVANRPHWFPNRGILEQALFVTLLW